MTQLAAWPGFEIVPWVSNGQVSTLSMSPQRHHSHLCHQEALDWRIRQMKCAYLEGWGVSNNFHFMLYTDRQASFITIGEKAGIMRRG